MNSDRPPGTGTASPPFFLFSCATNGGCRPRGVENRRIRLVTPIR